MRFKALVVVGILILFLGFTIPSNIHVLNFKAFEPHLWNNNDTTYVINFWASWCIPCREEMPAFEKLNQQYASKKVKVLLVSLDFPDEIESRVKPFIKKYNLKSEVVLLDDPNTNYWINRVDSSWSGAIPATIIYNKDFREFYEKTFTYNELDSIINLIQ